MCVFARAKSHNRAYLRFTPRALGRAIITSIVRLISSRIDTILFSALPRSASPVSTKTSWPDMPPLDPSMHWKINGAKQAFTLKPSWTVLQRNTLDCTKVLYKLPLHKNGIGPHAGVFPSQWRTWPPNHTCPNPYRSQWRLRRTMPGHLTHTISQPS